MSGPAYLLDVNVWLALAFPAHAHHVPAVEFLRLATPERPACFCRATQQGFLRLASSVAFQRSCNIAGLTNRDALAALQQMMGLPWVSYREEPAGIESVWHRLAAFPTASPKVWMDAYLAAFAATGGLELVTFDGGFSQFAGVAVTHLPPPAGGPGAP